MHENSPSLCGNPHCLQRRNDGGGLDRVTLFEANRSSSSEACVSESEPHVRCTDCLIRLYNGTLDESKKEALAQRLYAYGTVFGNLMPWKKAEVAKEYARVANIEVRRLRDRELVYSVLHTLRKTLYDDIYATAPFAKALSHVLVCLDGGAVFEGDPTELLHLADSLAQTLKRCIVQTREAHSSVIVIPLSPCIKHAYSCTELHLDCMHHSL